MENYFIVDIETCPINMENYDRLNEEEKIKLMNPIDSKIVAIGVRYKNNNNILIDDDEKKILKLFWAEWKNINQENKNSLLIGFNVLNFDIPFIVSRSFINNVEIVPFSLRSILDLKNKINAYRYGKSRGKLSDYGKFLGLEVSSFDGSKVASLWNENKLQELKNYLCNDLEITEQLFFRAKETKIIQIDGRKW